MIPKVSVITAAYNAAGTLERAVQSALRQSLGEIEVIVVDDGSTDGTWSRAEALRREDARVVLVRHRQNRGQATARNSGLDLARGTWVTPLDADDAYRPERLERLCALAERNRADFCADNLVFDDADWESAADLAYPRSDLDAASPLTAEAFIASDMPRTGRTSLGYLKPLMRLQFLREHGLRYDEDLHGPEDSNLYLAALIAGARFHCTGWAGYRYYRVPQSLTRTRDRVINNLESALLSNERLRVRARKARRPATLRQLREHERRLRAVLWMARVGRALRGRAAGDAARALYAIPRDPLMVLRVLGERLLRGPRPSRPTQGARPAD